MKVPFKVGLEEAITQLPLEAIQRFTVVMKHGTMSVEYYAPKFKDLQTPHLQDELYVIASGKGVFIRGDEKVNFTCGDVLFVPAGIKHKFENFSDDFATWVIFYGPDGGEVK